MATIHLKDDCDPSFADNRKLPYNSFLVTYVVDGETKHDVVSSNKKVDVFDEYWDKYRTGLISITQTEGRVNPKIFDGLDNE